MGILERLKIRSTKEKIVPEPDVRDYVSVLREPTSNKALEIIAKALQKRDTEIAKSNIPLKKRLESLAKESARKSSA